MITNMQFLGIYQDAIDDAIDSCETAMENLGFTDDEISDMNDDAVEYLKEVGDWGSITNSIIDAYFTATTRIIRDRFGNKHAVDYYVNCHDSHFYIDGEEVL